MQHDRKVSVIGLGYVGLTSAVAFSHIGKVIAFDISVTRIEELKNGIDRNNEITTDQLKSANLLWTANEDDLQQSDFFIISVPTPIDKYRHPDFSMLTNATKMVARQLKKGDIVVYESTVYPGATDEMMIPLLEMNSKLKCGIDFAVGYSPERVNPADKEHTFYNIKKIISATDNKALDILADLYKQVVKAGVFPVSSIKIAEAAKIIENIQRDINIALMNDVAIFFHKLNINTAEVIRAMATKWNFLPFKPGLVGGHCIGVNSYYLMNKGEQIGYHSDLITFGRRINEFITSYIVNEVIRNLINLGITIQHSRIAILGLTYKENCSDVRDTRVIDLINELKSYPIDVLVHDPVAVKHEAKKQYGIDLLAWDKLTEIDAIIITIAHHEYVNRDVNLFKKMLKNTALIIDINSILKPDDFINTNIKLWQL
jgi:UDP-N-acetyl-D-glucosamine/UDP-N-acetyl-D-galactosamine dehydrogenase